MTLEELDDEISKPKPKAYAYNSSTTSTEYNSWLKTRNIEDGFLRANKCPTCKLDVTVKVLGGTWHYTCTGLVNHTFLRYVSIHHGPSNHHTDNRSIDLRDYNGWE